jgi:hypothetical protein
MANEIDKETIQGIESHCGNSYSLNLKAAQKKNVVVVGGGPAGCGAALSARRNGADVILIERASYLGGNLTNGLGDIGIKGYRAGTPGNPPIVRGIGIEIFERLQAAGGAFPTEKVLPGDPDYLVPKFDPSLMVHLLDEMMEESNVQVLFNTVAFDAVVENHTVQGVAIANKSGGQVILADRVVDASADGDIAAAAGVPFMQGRTQDGRHHGCSLGMLIGGIHLDRFIDFLKNQPLLTEDERKALEEDRSRLLGGGRPPNIALSLDGKPVVREFKSSWTSWNDVEKILQEGGRLNLRVTTNGGGPFPGRATAPSVDGKFVSLPAGLDQAWIDYIKKGKVPPLLGAAALVYPPTTYGEIGVFRHGKRRYDQMMSGVYECWFDTTCEEETSRAILFMRKLNRVYLEFLRECAAGFENAYIVNESPSITTRESRRIIGEYILNEADMLENTDFPDVIARGGNRGPDAHNVTGLWGDGVTSKINKPFKIPYRCLVPKKIDNLLVAGRCMSATHLGMGGSRNIAICMSTGQAAGAAAAISNRLGTIPRNLDIKLLQKTLLQQGALLFLDDEKDKEQEVLSYSLPPDL